MARDYAWETVRYCRAETPMVPPSDKGCSAALELIFWDSSLIHAKLVRAFSSAGGADFTNTGFAPFSGVGAGG